MDSIYHFNATLIDGREFSFEQLRGRCLLIVNTASSCNFSHQYTGLERLHQDYHSKGLSVLGFPCDQFGHHEQGTNESIEAFCKNHYQVNFLLFSKVQVNGLDAHPLFTFLKTQTRGINQSRAIKWNFTKFIISPQGQLVNRYAPRTKPDTLRGAIESQLSRKLQLA